MPRVDYQSDKRTPSRRYSRPMWLRVLSSRTFRSIATGLGALWTVLRLAMLAVDHLWRCRSESQSDLAIDAMRLRSSRNRRILSPARLPSVWRWADIDLT